MAPVTLAKVPAVHPMIFGTLVLLITLLVLGTSTPVIAKQHGPTPPAGALPPVVFSVDAGASTITISEGDQTKLYHMDPFGTVNVNGAKSSLNQLAAGMVVSSLSLADPTTINAINVSEIAQPAAPGTGAQYKSSLSPAELAALTAKVGDSYWKWPSQTWIYLAADGKLVAVYRSDFVGKWTFADRYTLGIMDTPPRLSGAQPPGLLKFNASYTTAGNLVRMAAPTADMQSKVANLKP